MGEVVPLQPTFRHINYFDMESLGFIVGNHIKMANP